MARNPRFNLPGIPQHVIQRGTNRAPCCYGEGDYHRCLTYLKDVTARNHCRLLVDFLGATHGLHFQAQGGQAAFFF